MQAIIKIYQNQFSTTPLAQIAEVLDLSIQYDINSYDTAEIKIAFDVPNISQYRKIELYSVDKDSYGGYIDKMIFAGFIDSFKPSISDIQISAKSEKALLYRKLVTTNRSFSSQSIQTIISTILGDWNTAYSESWSVSSSVAGTISKDVKVGDNIFDIINEICEQTGAVWDSVGGTITIGTFIGTDYTSTSNFKELVFDGSDLRFNNINSLEYETFGTLSNIIIGDDGTTNNIQSDATSISNYGALAELKSFRPGNLSGGVTQYLTSKKNGQFVYRVFPDWTKFEAEAGDKVKLRVENVSPYFNFEGDVIINTKNVSIQNGTIISAYTISDKYVYFDNFVKRFLSVESDLNLQIVR